MEIWSKCDICGRDIPVGELCYGLKKGNCICKNCCTGFENCTFTLAPMSTLTPPNEPLTLEQLREMEDEPAYLNVFDPLLKSGWHIIKAVTEDKIIFRGWEKVYVPIDGMGIDYNLYRRPPEGEEDT